MGVPVFDGALVGKEVCWRSGGARLEEVESGLGDWREVGCGW